MHEYSKYNWIIFWFGDIVTVLSHLTKCNTNSKVLVISAKQTTTSFAARAFYLTQPQPHMRKRKHGRSSPSCHGQQRISLTSYTKTEQISHSQDINSPSASLRSLVAAETLCSLLQRAHCSIQCSQQGTIHCFCVGFECVYLFKTGIKVFLNFFWGVYLDFWLLEVTWDQ